MIGLCLYLFGAPRLERDGAPLAADTRKAVALLAYLAVTQRLHTRDALAALLWGDSDDQHARGALRRTLSVLRSVAGGGAIETSGDQVRAGGELWCDVVAFRNSARGDDAAHAVALVEGPFMSGFSLRASPDFEEWQFQESRALERELSDLLVRRARDLAAGRDFGVALEHARRLLRLDLLNEDAHRLLMTLYAQSGDHAAALRQYRECVRILDQELGVEPLPETTQLYRALRENRSLRSSPAPAPPSEPSRTGAPRSRLLVGRSQQWHALVEALEHSADGRCVALEGEAGIGKTRLAEEFLEYARTKGAGIAAGRCYEGESGVSYGIITQVLRDLLRSATCADPLAALPPGARSELARLLPELAVAGPAPTPTDAPDPGAAVRFLESLGAFLLGLCPGDQPLVLFFDDLHWADAASLDFLAYFIRRLAGRSVLVILAWRADGSAQVERLRLLMAGLARTDRGALLALPRLSLADIMALTQGGDVNDPARGRALAERLYRESEGVPLFVEAYLEAAAAGEAVVPEGLPPTIRDLFAARLAALGDADRQLLQAAAIQGRSFDLDVLQATSGRTFEETLAGVERLAAMGLIHEVATPGTAVVYDFDHDKLRILIAETTGAGRRRLLHERAGRAWIALAARRWSTEPIAALAAYHFEQAGQDAEAAEQHLVAARQAEQVYANADAVSHYRSALALGHGDPVAAHESIGDLEALRGDYSASLAAYEAAVARLPTGEGATGRIEHKLANLHARLGEWEAAESFYASAEQALRHASGEVRAGLNADWAFTAHRRGSTHQALARVDQALALATAAGDERAIAQSANVLGVLQRRQGELSAAIANLEWSCALAERAGDKGAYMAALNNLALTVADAGDIGRGVSLLQTALGEAMRRGDRHREAALRNNLADLLHHSDRDEEAMAELKQAVALFADIGVQAGEPRAEIWKLSEW